MSNNKELYAIIGGLAKSVVGDIIDKAVESSKQVSDFIDDEIKPKFEAEVDSEPKSSKKAILNENQLMQAFIEQHEDSVTPSWDRVNLCFVDASVDKEFKSFKNGYLLGWGDNE